MGTSATDADWRFAAPMGDRALWRLYSGIAAALALALARRLYAAGAIIAPPPHRVGNMLGINFRSFMKIVW